jgi:hypothetical protein
MTLTMDIYLLSIAYQLLILLYSHRTQLILEIHRPHADSQYIFQDQDYEELFTLTAVQFP